MEFSREMEAAMEDNAFQEKLNSLETEEEIKAAFNERGVDFEKEFAEDERGERELSEEDVESVAGGVISEAIIIALAPYAWKAGKMAGILIRSCYDAKKYRNPYRTYSKSKVEEVVNIIENLK